MNRLLLTDFNKDALDSFIEFSKLEGHKTVLLSTLGGSTSGCTMISDMINKDPENYTIEVHGSCYSAGFMLLLFTKCKVVDASEQFNVPTIYMYHCTQLTGEYTKEERTPIIEGDMKQVESIQHILTCKQLRKIKRYHFIRESLPILRRFFNDDTYLTLDQMQTLLGESRFEIR